MIVGVDGAGDVAGDPREGRHADLIRDRDQRPRALAQISQGVGAPQPFAMGQAYGKLLDRARDHILGPGLAELQVEPVQAVGIEPHGFGLYKVQHIGHHDHPNFPLAPTAG